MNDLYNKIGDSEGASAVAVFLISIFVFGVFSPAILTLTTGAWINYFICSIPGFVLLSVILKFYDIFGTENSFYISKRLLGNGFSSAIFVLLCISLIFAISSVLNISTSKIYEISNIKLNKNTIKFVTLITAVICALNGAEGITRLSYIVFYVIIAVFGILIFTSFDGIRSDNLFPVFGKNIITSVTPGAFSGLFGGFIILFLMSDLYKCKNNLVSSTKKIFVISAIGCFVLVLWYMLCVSQSIAFDMNGDLGAVFTSTVSGRFFRRFEIFLIVLYLLLQIISLCVGLYCLSKTFATIVGVNDFRPFVLSVSVLVLNISHYKIADALLPSLTVGFFLFLFVYLPCLMLINHFYVCDKGKKL